MGRTYEQNMLADMAIDLRARFHFTKGQGWFAELEKLKATNPVFFQLIDPEDPNTLPADDEPVLWFLHGEPPYAGSMADEDFPGAEDFQYWCAIPQPPRAITENVF